MGINDMYQHAFVIVFFSVVSIVLCECTKKVRFFRDAKANIAARLSAKHLSRTQMWLFSRAHVPLLLIVIVASLVFQEISLPVGILAVLIIVELSLHCILILISEAAQDLRKKDK